ncbi:MAG: MFS transporter, partial [Candidatus Nanopelagicales bacterium]
MLDRLLRQSALGEVRRSPRFLGLMGVMLVAAIGYGAREQARLVYTSELTGNASGIGEAAAIFAVGIAVGGLLGGRLSDRFNPSRVLIAALAVQGAASLVTAALIVSDIPWGTPYFLVTIVDGVFAGVGVPSLAATQAAVVPTTARGAAEIISILRLGIGGALGLVLAGLSPSPAVTLVAIGVAVLVLLIPIAVITNPVVFAAGRALKVARDQLLGVLRTHRVLSRVVVADLVLCVAIPTQFSNVFLATDRDKSLVIPILLSGVLGVLVGRLLLTLTGSHGQVRRDLVVSFGTFILVAVLGIPVVASTLVHSATWIPVTLLFIGSGTTAYAQGML